MDNNQIACFAITALSQDIQSILNVNMLWSVDMSSLVAAMVED